MSVYSMLPEMQYKSEMTDWRIPTASYIFLFSFTNFFHLENLLSSPAF